MEDQPGKRIHFFGIGIPKSIACLEPEPGPGQVKIKVRSSTYTSACVVFSKINWYRLHGVASAEQICE